MSVPGALACLRLVLQSLCDFFPPITLLDLSDLGLFCLPVKEFYGTRYQRGLLFLNFMWGVVFTACVVILFLLWLPGLVVSCFLIRLTAGFLCWLPLIGLAYYGLLAWIFAAYWSGLLACLLWPGCLLLPGQAYFRLLGLIDAYWPDYLRFTGQAIGLAYRYTPNYDLVPARLIPELLRLTKQFVNRLILCLLEKSRHMITLTNPGLPAWLP